MKRIIVTILALLPLLCGCDYEFALRGELADDRLNVICIANESGEIHLNIETATPINKYSMNERPDTKLEKVRLCVNGEECGLSAIDTKDGQSPSFPYGFNIWKADRTVSAGDQVEVWAKGVNTKEAYTKTVVPEKPVIHSVKVSRDSLKNGFGEKHYIRFDVEAGQIDADAFYGVKLEYRFFTDGHYYYDGPYTSADTQEEEQRDVSDGKTEIIQAITPHLEMDIKDILLQYGGTEALIEAAYNGFLLGQNISYRRLFTFTGKEFKAGRLSFYTPDFTSNSQIETDYRIHIYRLSDEFYRYSKATYMSDCNILGQIGLAPSNFSYSNIKNGFGVGASISETVSDWMSID